METLTLTATPTVGISGLKKKSLACLILFFNGTFYQATGADAAEIAFCSHVPLVFRGRGYEASMPDYLVIVWPHQIRRVIDELNAKGNPVGLIDKATGEIQEYWPLQNVESVDNYWLTLPFRAAMSTIEKSIEPLPEEPTDRVVSLLVDDVQALDAAWGFLQSSQTPLSDFRQTLTPFEVHF